MPDLLMGEVLLRFNFYKPFNPQLENAKLFLEGLRGLGKENFEKLKKYGVVMPKIRNSYKSHAGDWIKHIRILDALPKGVTNKEIASVFDLEGPKSDQIKYDIECERNEKSISKQNKAALKNLQGDYRLIPTKCTSSNSQK